MQKGLLLSFRPSCTWAGGWDLCTHIPGHSPSKLGRQPLETIPGCPPAVCFSPKLCGSRHVSPILNLTSSIIYRKSTEATLNCGCFQSDGRKGRYLPPSDPEVPDAVTTVPTLLDSVLYRSEQDPEFTSVPPSISNRQCVLNRPVVSDSLRPQEL